MGSPHRDVLRAIALARILTRHLLHRVRYSLSLWSILAGVIGLATILIIAPWGCTPKTNESAIPLSGRTIRVRLLQAQDQVTLKPAGPFIFRADAGDRQMNVAAGTQILLRLTDQGWLAGNMPCRDSRAGRSAVLPCDTAKRHRLLYPIDAGRPPRAHLRRSQRTDGHLRSYAHAV